MGATASANSPPISAVSARSCVLVEHDLFGKPASTFPDHALWRVKRRADRTGQPVDVVILQPDAVTAAGQVVEKLDLAEALLQGRNVGAQDRAGVHDRAVKQR